VRNDITAPVAQAAEPAWVRPTVAVF
jgi:hypothetical protein